MSLAENVKFLREQLGMTQAELGEKLGKGQTTIQKIETGQTLRPRFISDMADVLGIDVFTLEHGDATQPSEKLPLIPTQKTVGVLDPKNPPTSTHRRIIRYEVRLAAGEGKGTADWIVRENDDDPIYFRNGWFRARHLDEENLRGMYVRGDSMEPYLFNHDTVIIDVADTEISDGEVYAIVFKNRFYVKELRLMEGGVRIISHNEKYEPMEALDEDCKEEHDFQVLGRVVWRGG